MVSKTTFKIAGYVAFALAFVFSIGIYAALLLAGNEAVMAAPYYFLGSSIGQLTFYSIPAIVLLYIAYRKKAETIKGSTA